MKIKKEALWQLEKKHSLISASTSIFIIAYLFLGIFTYGINSQISALSWLKNAWNPETDYQHGFFIPLICLIFIYRQWGEIKETKKENDNRGLFIILLACLFYFAGHRVLQPRITLGALPFFLWGSILFLYGKRIAKICFFPIFFFLASIPLPNFQQATTQLQILATQLAEWGTNLISIQTISEGSTLFSINKQWEPLSISGGCSGIRSLIALFTFSVAWAYLSQMNLPKKIIFSLSAIPIAILGNTCRLISIFAIAEWINPKIASGFWHNWSGLLVFYPFSLFLLSLLNQILQISQKNEQ